MSNLFDKIICVLYSVFKDQFVFTFKVNTTANVSNFRSRCQIKKCFILNFIKSSIICYSFVTQTRFNSKPSALRKSGKNSKNGKICQPLFDKIMLFFYLVFIKKKLCFVNLLFYNNFLPKMAIQLIIKN
jgi:hypothetical protein